MSSASAHSTTFFDERACGGAAHGSLLNGCSLQLPGSTCLRPRFLATNDSLFSRIEAPRSVFLPLQRDAQGFQLLHAPQLYPAELLLSAAAGTCAGAQT